ncbi:MAG: ABC transporter permease [Alphaproteobacteria bacterium]|nr:ABC transporter permease [Alphaproteobacteria bacterium]
MNIASNSKTAQEQHPKKPPGILRRLPSSTVGMVGLGLILFWVVMALIVPFLPIPSYSAMDVDAIHNPYPEWGGHLLGTDRQGRDILARLLWGGQTVLLVAPFATLCAYVIGMPLGLAAGYYGGKVDMILSRLADIILSFPILVLYVLLVTILGASIINIVIAVVLASCPAISRIVRGLTLEQRTHDYVAAASLRRENAMYIMFIEILPNCRGPLITDFCLRVGYTIITIGVLGFLGLGLPPPTPDWGGMVKDATTLISTYPHMALIPSFAITSLVLGFNMLADGIRELSLKD